MTYFLRNMKISYTRTIFKLGFTLPQVEFILQPNMYHLYAFLYRKESGVAHFDV